MTYLIIDDPLKPIYPCGFKGLTVPLNIAESRLRSIYGRKLEVVDLSDTFDLGLSATFKAGKLTGWEVIPVF